jgi:hypothetical protein
MRSPIVSEIHRRLTEFLSGKTEFHEFEDWFVPILWELADGTDETARQLVGQIHILIAEFSRGDRTADSLREELAKVVSQLSELTPSLAS